MNDLVNSFKSVALSFGEILTPVLKESKFKETGVITPEEFVAAGDHLVHHCPTWFWSKASTGKTKEFLPLNKQFLITKHVPCHRCYNQMQYDENKEKIINEKNIEGGLEDEWVETYFSDNQKAVVSKANTLDTFHHNTDSALKNLLPCNDQYLTTSDNDDEEDPIDMTNFIESGALEDDDPNLFVHKSKKPINLYDTNKINDEDEEFVKTRTYDLHITYDKYYQVARFWLLGYDEKNELLDIKKMKEDFSQDHADKTITLEAHPQLDNLTMATIHPCRHASVMKRLIEQFFENGKDLSVLDYLFVFLKFVQAVIPTLEYDYTRSIQL